MDAGEVAHFAVFKREVWENQLTRALARHLAPAVFRFGGTEEDYTEYSFDGTPGDGGSCDHLLPEPTHPCIRLNGTQIDTIAAFADTVGWDLVWGVNVGTARTATNAWDPSQLAALLSHAQRTNLSLYGLELGNEPGLMCVGPHNERYSCHHAPPNTSWGHTLAISPAQLAADYAPFRTLVRAQQPAARIIGNDVTDGSLARYALPFLGNLSHALDAFSWHFYYGPGSSRPHGLNASQFSEPDVLDKFLRSAMEAAAVARGSGRGAQLWLGETSSTYGGGTANVSASFVAGFMWLDKLGIAALLGHHLVARQTFAHSSYSVIGAQEHGVWDSLPNPDYWSTLLWRRLVGHIVLGTDDLGAFGREVRAYAFCAASSMDGAVALVVLNTKELAVDLEIEVLRRRTSPTHRAAGKAEVYLLTSFPGTITSRAVFLNGHLLKLANQQTGELPPLEPVHLAAGQQISMPAKSYGFVVLPDAECSACKTEKPRGASEMVEWT